MHASSLRARSFPIVLAIVCIGSRGRIARAQDTSHVHGGSAAADSARRLETVQIIAAPAERSQPVSITHVDALEIRVTPSNNPYDLLRQTAGVDVHLQGQGPGFASDASLRGFSSDHSTDIALWVDGVPINEPVNGHAEGYNDWTVLFPGGIQDIDVIRGPTNALFGNFAMAGVVNVRTMERMRGTEFTAGTGSFGRAEAMVMTGFDHGASGGGMVGAHYLREDGFRPNSRNDVVHAHGRIVHDLNSAVRIDAGTELYGSNWNSPGFLSEDEFKAHQYGIVSNPTDGGYKRRAQERVSLRVLTGNMLWRTTAYATEGRWQLYLTIPPAGGRFEGSGSQTEEEDSRAGAGATTALTWSLPNGEVTLGGETRWDRSHYENYFTTARRRDSVAAALTGRQLLGAPFLQSYFNITDRLRVDAGLRYDVLGTLSTPDGPGAASLDGTHAVLSPKLGALVHLSPAVGLFGNVSRGFRSSDGVIENPSLEPITEWAYETGLKLDRGPLSASATLFRMDVSNEQTFNPITLESENGGASRRQGLELDLKLPPIARLATVSGNWTFNDARYRHLISASEDGGEPPANLDGLRVYNTSRSQGETALDLAPAHAPWRVRLSGTWALGYSPFDEPGVVLPGYGLGNVGATYTFGSVELDGGLRNAFDRAYAELVAGHVYSPGEPRTFYLKFRVHE